MDTAVERYLKSQPPEVLRHLKSVRALIRKSAPKAVESMKYGVVTYTMGENLVHFGGFKAHVGFYPGPATLLAFKKELSTYESAKGSVKFPIDQKMPLAIIKKIVLHRVRAVTSIPEKIGNPALRALKLAKIVDLKKLSSFTEADILAMHGVGKKAVGILKVAMKKQGLKFKPKAKVLVKKSKSKKRPT